MEKIKEKLNKINSSIQQCDLRSEEDNKQETKNVRPDVRTLYHISLEPPAKYALKSYNTKRNESNTTEEIIAWSYLIELLQICNTLMLNGCHR